MTARRVASTALVVGATTLAGCAGHAAMSAPPPAGVGVGYVAQVAPFPVEDEEGRLYDVPFLGGYNLPRPQLVDVDGDGDADLFVQEYSNHLTFFERVGGPVPRYEWRTDRFADLEVGEWYRFADVDGDGDMDLLAERPYGYISYYRNDGRPGAPRFVLAADTLYDVGGQPIFSDRQNIPNVGDIDCDGRPDLFIGRLVGTVTRYETESFDARGVPRFRHVTDNFENISIVAQIGSFHGANTLTLVDVDGDGDEDLFWGDFFEAGLLFIENTGTCEHPVFRGEPVPFPRNAPLKTSGYNAPTFGDVDGDGDIDLIVGVVGGAYNLTRTSADNLYYYEQTARGTFTERSARFLRQIDVGSESIPVLVDIDADGDLDLLVANKIEPDDPTTSRIYQFLNAGTPKQPAFRLTGTWDLKGTFHFAPAFGDLDGDGDLDMIMGSWTKDLALYRNRGTAARPDFVLVDSAFVSITRGSNTTPALVDIDGDGDLDLFVGESSGALNYYRNVGTRQVPRFELVSDTWGEIDIGRRSFPTFVDLDGDGDFDLVLGRDAGGVVCYRNVGTRSVPAFQLDESLALRIPPLSAPAFGDLDGDGDLDVVAGNVGGGLVYFEKR